MSTLPSDPIDLPTLDGLRDAIGDEALAEIVGMFIADCPRLVEQVREAVTAGDTAVAQRAAHQLKATAGSLGALRLEHLAADIEHSGKEGNISEEQALALGREAEEVVEALGPLA